MIECVLQDEGYPDPYVDDIIIGSTGQTREELLRNHARDVTRVLQVLEEQKLVFDPRKSHFFMEEVEFCGHILREGRRSPAPGKLLPIQKWEIPHTVTALRGFLGLTNYYSEYVPGYAEKAGPLMEKLKLPRHVGKKGSTFALKWTDEEVKALSRSKPHWRLVGSFSQSISTSLKASGATPAMSQSALSSNKSARGSVSLSRFTIANLRE